MDFLKELDAVQQKAAVDIEGPSLIYAGAGSGKTRVVTYRIAHMLNQGIKPENILCFTFTNKAANEMKTRIHALVGDQADNIWIGTFHSTCVKILRYFGKYADIASNFTIVDTSDTNKIIKDVMKNLGREEKLAPDVLRHAISGMKRRLCTLDDYCEELAVNSGKSYSELYRDIFLGYSKELHRLNAMDFDDLIKNTIRLMENSEEAHRILTSKFKYISVDEYQDTALAESRLVNLLAQGSRNLCVVGDPRQAIYGFKNADYKIIMAFKDLYKDASVHVLNRNYRSAQNVVNAAESVVGNNKMRPDYICKPNKVEAGNIVIEHFTGDRSEADAIAEEIKVLVSEGSVKRYADIAVLYRTHAVADVFLSSFEANGIPYTVVGAVELCARQEVKDVASYLTLLINEDYDVATERALKAHKGIGSTTVSKLRDSAIARGTSILRLLREDRPDDVGKAAWSRLQDFRKELTDARAKLASGIKLPDLIVYVLQVFGIQERLDNDKQSEKRLKSIDTLLDIANEHDGTALDNLEFFMERLSLNSTEDKEDPSNAVRLMTIHQAKGLEFPSVFVVGCEEGLLPHYKSIGSDEGLEEERRLFYVAMTRAIDNLYLTSSNYRVLYGNINYQTRSRFIKEVNI